MTLRTQTHFQNGAYQGSKWLKFQVLCDPDELEKLFNHLQPFSIYPLTGVISLEQIPMSPAFFLQEYASWIEGLKRGVVPTDAQLRKVLACAFTQTPDALYLQDLSNGRYLVKIAQPVIQVQTHYFTYSSIDGVFRPMSMGSDSIFWGIQLSYPQIYQHSETMDLLESGDTPNAELFQKVREWIREATRATPFFVDGKKINVPIRIGKNCLSWAGNHPQLKTKSIGIAHAN
jgi:hypothetical protein